MLTARLLPLKLLPRPRPSPPPTPIQASPHLPSLSIPPESQSYADILVSYSQLFARHLFDECPVKAQIFRNCRLIHARFLRLGLHLSGKAGNALIDLYSKSGGSGYARNAFNLMEETDLVSWNSVLSAYLRGGSPASVLRSFASMLRSGLSPDQFSFATALSACARLSVASEGRRLHCLLLKLGLSSNRYCEASLVDMYAKSGLLSDSRKVFDRISEPDIIAWTSMIAGYASGGMPEEALRLFSRMRESGIAPDRVTAVAAMTAYSSLGRLGEARSLFEQIPSPNDVAWNAIISGHAQNGCEDESLAFFRDMRRRGARPTRSTVGSILSAAANSQALDEGRQVHAEAIKLGLSSNVFVGSSLINMYSKCGCTGDAGRAFRSSNEKNAVTWNAMLGSLLQRDLAEEAIELFLEMKGLDSAPDGVSYVTVVGACARAENLDLGRQFHSLAIKMGMDAGIFLGNALIDMYSKCGELGDASRQLGSVASRDIVSWNAIIVGHARRNGDEEALDMFRRMRGDGVVPDQVSCSSIISACSNMGALDEGKQMHCLSLKSNLSSNPCVGSSLVDFYARFGELDGAVSVFSRLTEKTLPPVNALIHGYVRKKDEERAVMLFKEMRLAGMRPSRITFGSILPACGGRRATTGRQMHCHMSKSGLLGADDDGFLRASLLAMYLRSSLPEDADKLLLEMPDDKGLMIWTIVISGYSQNGCGEEALLLFQKMRENDLGFDEAILASVLRACADLAALADGGMVHSIIIRTGFHSHKRASIKLIDMYSKCGDAESSLRLFGQEEHKEDVVMWNSMIFGLAKNGYAQESLEIFHQMQQRPQMNPDDVTFLGVLTACCHAGLIADGRGFFRMMSGKYGIIPRAHHHACMIDLLGRGGHFEEAEELIDGLPYEPDGLIWATMLAASRMHGDFERGERAAEKLMKLEPDNSSPYMLLSSIYAASGRCDGAKRLRHDMRERGVKKLPGCSWIEVRKKTSLFVAGDKFHPEANVICEVLDDLNASMKDDGHVSDVFVGWLDEDDEFLVSTL